MLVNLIPLVSYFFYALILSYLIWGFIVSFEVNLALSNSKSAIKWIKKHYSYKSLYTEVLVFYPLIILGYFFLEVFPHYFDTSTEVTKFDLDNLFKQLFS